MIMMNYDNDNNYN